MKIRWVNFRASTAVVAFLITALLAMACGSDDEHCDAAQYQAECIDGLKGKSCIDGKVVTFRCSTDEYCDKGRCFNPSLKCNVNDEVRCDDDHLGFSACIDNQLVQTPCVDDEVCRINEDNKPYCAPTCENGRWDKGELAVDCGGPCKPCKPCVNDDDCESGFCDSAKGHVCSKPCKDAIDCQSSEAPLDNICRNDGRCGPEIFEAIWRVSGGDRTIVLPHDGKGECNCEVLWGDEGHDDFSRGTKIIDCSNLEKRSHKYSKDDNYRVKIRGIYNGFGNDSEDIDDCLSFCDGITAPAEIISFGTVGLSKGAFQCAKNFKLSSRDIPNPRLWTDASNLFRCSEGFNNKIETWDSSNVTQMAGIFRDARDYNQSVSKLKTAKVTDLSAAFKNTPEFDQALDTWDVSSVESLSQCFAGTTKFNQDLSSWNTKSLKDLSSIFERAEKFNQALPWNTARVTTMAKAFKDTKTFNQALNWDLTHTDDASEMFHSAKSFNQVLSEWQLKEGVILTDILNNSGISKENYCELISKDIWKDAQLGDLYTCE